jgi:hypothetical protein
MSERTFRIRVWNMGVWLNRESETPMVGVFDKIGTVVITDLRVLPDDLTLYGELEAARGVILRSNRPEGESSCDVQTPSGDSLTVLPTKFVIQFTKTAVEIYVYDE